MQRFFYKYKFFISPVLFPVVLFISTNLTGFWTFVPVLSLLVVISLLDFILPNSYINPSSKQEQEELLNDKTFDILIWFSLPLLLGMIYYYLNFVSNNIDTASWVSITGWSLNLGVLVGTVGLGIGHELGHRQDSWQRFLGKALLLTHFNMNYYLEHNWGHHKKAATKEDPNTAYRNELFYTYFFRSVVGMWLESYKIQAELNRKRGTAFFSIYNDVLWYAIFHLAFAFSIYYIFGLQTLLAYFIVVFFAFLTNQLADYNQHYGLRRKKNPNGSYQRTLPMHSWNSDHFFSSAVTFNLPRHSDHHFIADRHYQVLQQHTKAPLLPMGYTGMIFLTLMPPLYFYVMNKRIDDFLASQQ